VVVKVVDFIRASLLEPLLQLEAKNTKMPKAKKGEGRGLEHIEVALMKRMILDRFPRDRIMSFFVRPGRVISPAAKSEVEKGKIGPDIEPASPEELERFVTSRLNELRPFEQYAGPLSPSRVREVVSLTKDAQESLPGFENQFCEYKLQLPTDRLGRVSSCEDSCFRSRTHAADTYSSASVMIVWSWGSHKPTRPNVSFRASFSASTESFSPSFRWDHAIIEIARRPSLRSTCTSPKISQLFARAITARKIHKGHIYARYSAITRLIELATCWKC